MLSYILGRLAQSVLVLFLVSIVAFALVLLSGDPVAIMLPIHATEQDRLTLRHELGLDQPVISQYVSFVGRLAQGDLGRSIKFNQPVLPLIVGKLPADDGAGGRRDFAGDRDRYSAGYCVRCARQRTVGRARVSPGVADDLVPAILGGLDADFDRRRLLAPASHQWHRRCQTPDLAGGDALAPQHRTDHAFDARQRAG